MAFSSCFCLPPLPLKPIGPLRSVGVDQRLSCALKSLNSEHFGQQVAGIGTELQRNWNFIGGSRVIVRPQVATFVYRQKVSRIQASCLKILDKLLFRSGLAGSQIASNAFTLGTAAVLPFYTLMVFAPKAELTKKSMQSSIPYIVLGLLYAYLLFLSWTPDTLRLMFASKYWLPELPGIAKMFSNEMTLASAWIHLLAVDLFAARQVFHDGLENQIETRHSVSLCLLFCPIGIVTHFITKAMTKSS